jgi:hypothetical protein
LFEEGLLEIGRKGGPCFAHATQGKREACQIGEDGSAKTDGSSGRKLESERLPSEVFHEGGTFNSQQPEASFSPNSMVLDISFALYIMDSIRMFKTFNLFPSTG